MERLKNGQYKSLDPNNGELFFKNDSKKDIQKKMFVEVREHLHIEKKKYFYKITLTI